MRTLETEQEKKERKNKKQKRTALKARKMSCINKNEVFGISKHSARLSCQAQKMRETRTPTGLFWLKDRGIEEMKWIPNSSL